MCSTFNASSRPAAWTLDQPTTSPEAEVAVNSCEFQSSGFNATGFAAAELSSTGFQRVSESLVEENGLTLPDTNISPDAGMVRCKCSWEDSCIRLLILPVCSHCQDRSAFRQQIDWLLHLEDQHRTPRQPRPCCRWKRGRLRC